MSGAPSARRWSARTAPTSADLGVLLDVGQLDGREPQGGRSDPDRRRTDVPLTEMTGVDDAPVLDLDERSQLIGLAEAVARAQVLEIVIRSGGGSS